MRKTILILCIALLSFFFTGCELNEIFGPSKKEIELKQREMALKEQEIKFNQSLKQKDLDASLALKEKETNAKIENDKAVIETKKEVELAKIKSTIEKEKIQIEKHKLELQNKEKDLKYSLDKQDKDLEFNLAKQESTNSLSTKKYIIIFGSVLTLVVLIILFIYYNNRRKDKLRAYEDNLDKYFREKENQAKIEIASKILDTIASGKLNSEQENRLISTFSGDSKTSQTALLHEKTPSAQIPKVEIIHDIDDIAESSSK